MLRKLFITSFALMTLLAPNSSFAQRSYSFNATTLNVDGLPNKILGINVNPDGKEEEGAKAIGNETRTKGWDIVAMSEDFNFHDYLIAPISDLYYAGTHGGKVSGLSNKTDGLGLLLTKKTGWKFSNETRVKWKDHYGETDHGADGLIDKGFRYYTITIAPGVEFDFYCLHMDAEDDPKDIQARESQLTQLVEYIKSHDNGRNILILGDTNCRYTRDNVKGKLIDPINAVDNFTIHDAWIELIRGGAYPNLGDPAIMIGDKGPQMGEVVDKIFWIENSKSPLKIKANSFLHDTSFTASDHYPLTVNFTITDPNGTPATNSDYTLPESATAVAQEIVGNSAKEVAASGETCFLMNLSTKKYLQAGANWGTHAVEAVSAMPLTLTLVDKKYRINTIQGSVSAEAEPYMDNGNNNTWTFEQVAGKEYQYIIRCDAGALASTGDNNLVKSVVYNANNDKQKWVILTEAKLKEIMVHQASAAEPFNITPLVKGADFGKMDGWNDPNNNGNVYAQRWWSSTVTPTFGGENTGSETGYHSAAMYDYAEGINVNQTITKLPIGKYIVSLNACYREQSAKYAISSIQDHNRDSWLSFKQENGNTTKVTIPNDRTISSASDVSALFFQGNYLLKSETIQLSENTDVSIGLYLQSAKEKYKRACKLGISNIQLYYYGDGDDTEIDPYITFKNKVAKRVNETWAKVQQLNDAGKEVYDISSVIYRYNENNIKSDDDVDVLCKQVDAAYKRALIASLNNEPSGDMTALIENPSFETGDMTGWGSDLTKQDVGVKANSNNTYTSQGCDGEHLFNSYNGDNETTAPYVYQTISGVKNGLYEVKALLTSFDGRSVFLIGNNSHKAIVAENKGKFTEATLQFLVEDGNITIGAVGGSGEKYDKYRHTKGCFFKADNFRVKYICNVANGRIKLAAEDIKTKAATLTDNAGASIDLSEYENGIEAGSYTGDGKAEMKEMYAQLNTAVKKQRTKNADMTFAIVNPNFEYGDMTGWTCATSGWETKVTLQDNGTYTTLGAEGSHLFNTWDGDNAVKPLTQNVTDIPNGKYMVSALVAMEEGNNIALTVNGQTATTAAVGPGTMALVSGEYNVTDHKAEISLGSDNGKWFKADDFHMTFIGNELTMNETDNALTAQTDYYTSVTVNRTIKADAKWNTLVLPFNMEIPAGWEVKELTDDTEVDANGNIHLRFATANSIEAGKPYMIRVNEAVNKIEVENVDVDTKTPTQIGNGINFVGVYTAGNIPTGAFFISNNKFYHATGGQNIIKGMRAYLQLPEGSQAKAITYDISDVPTAIDNINTSSAATAIYDIQGNRLNSMTKGVNIVKMANGMVKKVIVK